MSDRASFISFSETIDASMLKSMARPMGLKIKSFSKLYVNDDTLNPEETLAAFFSEVHALTGEQRDYQSSETYTVLVNNWQSKRSTKLLCATYFFLHNVPAGYALAHKLDREIYDGRLIFDVHPNLELPSSGSLRSISSSESPQPTLVKSWSSASVFHFSNKSHKTTGRSNELTALQKLFEVRSGFHWAQLAGGAGQGKTTLVSDLLLSAPSDWRAGFLDQLSMENFSTKWDAWEPSAPHLIVVDYVVSRINEISRVFGALARVEKNLSHPVVFLLVERQCWKYQSAEKSDLTGAKATSVWFDNLNSGFCLSDFSNSQYTPPISSGGNNIVELRGLSDCELYDVALGFSNEQNLDFLVEKKVFVERLRAIDGSGRPLYACMLAMAFAHGSYESGWTEVDLLDDALARERVKRWRAFYKRDDPNAQAFTDASISLAAIATMCGGISSIQIRRVTSIEQYTPGDILQARIMIDNQLDPAGSTSSGLEAIEPDILGEWFVVRHLERKPDAVGFARDCWEINYDRFAGFLVRICQDFPRHSVVRVLLSFEPTGLLGQKHHQEYATRILEAYLHAISFNGDLKELLEGVKYEFLGPLMLSSVNRVVSASPHSLASWAYYKARSPSHNLSFFLVSLLESLEGFYSTIDTPAAIDILYNLGVRRARKSYSNKGRSLGLRLLKYAAVKGDQRAWRELVYGYRFGFGPNAMSRVHPDVKQFVDWLDLGVENEDAAMLNLRGVMRIRGDALPKDYERAYQEFCEAAAQGDNAAKVNCALCSVFGFGADRSFSSGIADLEDLVVADVPESLLAYCVICHLTKNRHQPRIEVREASRKISSFKVSGKEISPNWAKLVVRIFGMLPSRYRNLNGDESLLFVDCFSMQQYDQFN